MFTKADVERAGRVVKLATSIMDSPGMVNPYEFNTNRFFQPPVNVSPIGVQQPPSKLLEFGKATGRTALGALGQLPGAKYVGGVFGLGGGGNSMLRNWGGGAYRWGLGNMLGAPDLAAEGKQRLLSGRSIANPVARADRGSANMMTEGYSQMEKLAPGLMHPWKTLERRLREGNPLSPDIQ